MTPTIKPQCQAARDFVLAMHAKKNGTISDADYKKAGAKLNASVEKHGKP